MDDNMKKLVATIIMICVVLCCFGCSAENNDNKILYEKSMKAVELMLKKADEKYIESIFGDRYNKVFSSHVDNIQANRYLKPSKILQIELEDEWVDLFEIYPDMIDLAEIHIEKSLGGIVLGRICSPEETSISHMLEIESSFVNSEFKRNKTWFLYFDGAYAVSVTFIKGEDGTVMLNSQFICSMNFYDLTLDAIMEIYVDSVGESFVKIEEIVV